MLTVQLNQSMNHLPTALAALLLPLPLHAQDLIKDKGLAAFEFRDKEQLLEPSAAWKIEDGVLVCAGAPQGYLATREEFENFTLELEWRWAPGTGGGNSGVLIHAIPGQPGLNQWPMCLEVQLMKNNAGDFWVMGNGMAIQSDRPSMKPQGVPVFRLVREDGIEEKPPGEWNQMKIVSRGGAVTVEVNGKPANAGKGLKPTRGRVALQSEGAPIHFRNFKITGAPPAP